MSGDPILMLPPLTAEQSAHSARVLAALRAAIEAHDGWLAFDDYLRTVLYQPGLGYYSAGSVKIGSGGDFVTAPELSPLFAQCVAVHCASVLQAVGDGQILELGGGTGRLAHDLLRRLASLNRMPGRYRILEVSAELRDRQQALLQQLPPGIHRCVEWLESLPDQPFPGIVLANEVADALPFKRFVVRDDRMLERGVALGSDGSLIDSDRDADAALRAELARLAPGGWPAPYLSEVCPLLNPWIASLARTLSRGELLLFDYGLPRHEYYHAQRSHGTLRCHFRHRAHDQPLLHPGVQDITAWVDFTRIAEAAEDANLEVAGFCTQTAFLLETGIETQVAQVEDTVTRARLASQARVLLLPGEMGENVKVICLTRGLDSRPVGFALQDLRRSL